MTHAEILSRIENAEPLNKEKVKEALKVFNEEMEKSKMEIQKRNRDGDNLASQARLTT